MMWSFFLGLSTNNENVFTEAHTTEAIEDSLLYYCNKIKSRIQAAVTAKNSDNRLPILDGGLVEQYNFTQLIENLVRHTNGLESFDKKEIALTEIQKMQSHYKAGQAGAVLDDFDRLSKLLKPFLMTEAEQILQIQQGLSHSSQR